MAKVQRQPWAWLMMLTTGTPSTVPTVRPISMVETARVRK